MNRLLDLSDITKTYQKKQTKARRRPRQAPHQMGIDSGCSENVRVRE
jgi:hypothetical protein